MAPTGARATLEVIVVQDMALCIMLRGSIHLKISGCDCGFCYGMDVSPVFLPSLILNLFLHLSKHLMEVTK